MSPNKFNKVKKQQKTLPKHVEHCEGKHDDKKQGARPCFCGMQDAVPKGAEVI